MTCEEAIKELEELKAAYDIPAKSAKNETFRIEFENAAKAVSFALAALRAPTREQVEKVWMGEWIGSADGYADGELVYDIWECSECGYGIDEEDDPNMLPQFCPKCYAAMTDEAVDIVMKRLEALKND